ncbi:hypothetical protein EG329_002995 [Mollisiaceae sp. DMI_Dod_QoI]|nr:hypothetical protein EG329_002995 [Helotiales sp. DMI_Dod_QoI]
MSDVLDPMDIDTPSGSKTTPRAVSDPPPSQEEQYERANSKKHKPHHSLNDIVSHDIQPRGEPKPHDPKPKRNKRKGKSSKLTNPQRIEKRNSYATADPSSRRRSKRLEALAESSTMADIIEGETKDEGTKIIMDVETPEGYTEDVVEELLRFKF